MEKILLIDSLYQTRPGGFVPPHRVNTAADLAQRFAREDSDEDEYTRRLQVLNSSSTSPLNG